MDKTTVVITAFILWLVIIPVEVWLLTKVARDTRARALKEYLRRKKDD
jgi:hypothetical protein